jgi:hypothetical protein
MATVPVPHDMSHSCKETTQNVHALRLGAGDPLVNVILKRVPEARAERSNLRFWALRIHS